MATIRTPFQWGNANFAYNTNPFPNQSKNPFTWDFTSSPAQTALAGTNSTIEFWVFRLPKSGTYQCMFSTAGDSNNFILLDSTTLQVTSNGGTEMFRLNPDTYIPLNTWTHVALTCSGTTWTLYFNGTSYGTYSGASKSNTSGTAQLGGRNDMNGCGYLSNFRISTISRYSGNFTPSTTPFVSDGSTAMLTCQSNRFVDNSANAQALSINGTMSVQRFNPFGTSTAYSTAVIGGSGYFDGSGDYLTCSASVPATGAFTVEMFVYPTSTAGYQLLLSQFTSGDAGNFQILWDDTNNKFTVNLGASTVLTSSTTFSLNAWYHLAITRDGSNNMTMWVNGASAATTTNSTSILQTTTYIASRSALDGYFNGYLSNIRVTNTAVYTTAFTPPTAPLTAISGTSLLTNFTNAAIFYIRF